MLLEDIDTTRNRPISVNYLKEESDLLGRFLVVSRSPRSMDEKEAIGNYEIVSYIVNLHWMPEEPPEAPHVP